MAAWGQTNWIDEANTDWYDDNSGDTEFTISTPAQLAGLAKLVNGGNDFSGKTIKLGNDIQLNNTSGWGSWETTPPKYSWTPIGTLQNQFYGTFDGHGNTVSGIYISVDKTNQGLFGYLNGGTIQNLIVEESYIKGSSHIGGIVGFAKSSTVSNCSNSGSVAAVEGTYDGVAVVGGIVGYGSNVEVSNCSNSGSVAVEGFNAIYAIVGGIIGNTLMGSYGSGSVSNCSNRGSVAGKGSGYVYVGGIVGSDSFGLAFEMKVMNCSNSGSVIGKGERSNSSVCVGGVVGKNGFTQVSNCSNSGKVRGDDDGFVGGVVGVISSANVSNCYYLDGTCDKGIGGGSGITENVKMKTEADYKSGDVLLLLDPERETWGQDFNNGGYPVPLGSLSAEEQAAAKVYSATFTYTLPDAQEESVKIKYGNSDTQLTVPEVKVPDGYTFAWDNEVPAKFGTTDLTFNGTFTKKSATTYTLTIDQPENGTISATVNGTPISGEEVAEGATVTLTATPNSGYEFDSWSVTDVDNNEVAVTNNTFTMPASDVTVTATFKEKTEPDPGPTYYIITVDDNMTNGQVTASSATAEEGENVTLTVNPYSGYELGSLSVTDANGGSVPVNNYTFTMPASDVTVTATFKEKTEPDPGPTYYTIIVDDNMTNGQVTASSATAEVGENVTLKVNPDSGYELWSLSVTDANGGSVPVNNYTFTMPASDVTVTATFTEIIPEPEPEPEPEPTYFTLDFDDHPCEGVTLNSNLTAVEEGGTLYLYVEKEDETLYDYDNMRIYAKRGANADWEELTEDPNRPGVYPIERIWTDIFIKVEGVTPIDPPTAIAGVETLRIYATAGLLHVETPTRQRVTIVSMAGALIADGEQEGARIYRDLNAGIYIVRVGDYATKVRVE